MNLLPRNPTTQSKLKWLNVQVKNEINHKKLAKVRMKQAVYKKRLKGVNGVSAHVTRKKLFSRHHATD